VSVRRRRSGGAGDGCGPRGSGARGWRGGPGPWGLARVPRGELPSALSFSLGTRGPGVTARSQGRPASGLAGSGSGLGSACGAGDGDRDGAGRVTWGGARDPTARPAAGGRPPRVLPGVGVAALPQGPAGGRAAGPGLRGRRGDGGGRRGGRGPGAGGEVPGGRVGRAPAIVRAREPAGPHAPRSAPSPGRGEGAWLFSRLFPNMAPLLRTQEEKKKSSGCIKINCYWSQK
jgi:hypothetical protein